jgi:hypothetical protein
MPNPEHSGCRARAIGGICFGRCWGSTPFRFCSSFHGKCNYRPPKRTSHLFQFLQQLRFQIVRINTHFTGRNLRIRSAVKAKFAHSQPVFRSHRRAKRAARHRAVIVKLAQSRLRIEHWTHLIIGKFRKALFRLQPFVKHAGLRIPGKFRRQPRHRISRPLANRPSPPRVRFFEVSQSLPQPHPIQLIDSKHAPATLRASRTTH